MVDVLHSPLSKKLHTFFLILFPTTLLSLALYSYVLVDPNLTLLNHPLWTQFREVAVNIGYHNRNISWNIYFVLVITLFAAHTHLTKHSKKYSPIKVALLCAFFLLLSYPFLSHDFFNYLFDARILTYHHQNPYTHMALDYPTDTWTRFLHWTDRTYPYGPSWLLLSLVPSAASVGKFILNFFTFKLMFAFFYLAAVFCLQKMKKQWAMFFATHPLVLIEGLTNAHNDLIAVSISIIGIYLLSKKNGVLARVFLIISSGVKYTTLPLMILQKPQLEKSTSLKSHLSGLNVVALVGISLLLFYLSFVREVQPWYFLTLFALIPYAFSFIRRLQIFFFGLLMSYYPYIALGGWTKASFVTMKHSILALSSLLTLLYLFFLYVISARKSHAR